MENTGKVNSVMSQLWFIHIRMNVPRTQHNWKHSTVVGAPSLPLG